MPQLETARLLLRHWRDDDAEPFAAMSADPAVMEHYPSTLTREQSDATIERIRGHFAREGFGFWAIEVPGVAPFVGFAGLARPDTMPVTRRLRPHAGLVEVGWRLARPYWGHGYATEAARAAVAWGFANIVERDREDDVERPLDEIVAFVVPANVRSQHVMDRIGMQRDPSSDFEHPRIAVGHPLRAHWLYRLAAVGAAAMALVVGAAGCWHQPEHTETINSVIVRGRMDSDGFDGAEVSGGGGWSGVQFEAIGHFQQIEREVGPSPEGGDPNRHGGFGIDFALRASLFGIIAKEHRLDKWFDIGGFGGAGGGLFKPTIRIEGYGQVWGGAWTQIGLMPGSKYWALFLDVRRVSYKGEILDDTTVFGVGLGFVQRRPGYPQIRD